MTQPNAAYAPALAYLADNQPLSPLAGATLRLAVIFEKWATRQRTRRSLSRLDPHLLKDIGLAPRAADTEARKMFWQG